MDEKSSLGNGSKSITAQPRYNGIRNVLASVYREGGMRGLYRGVGMYPYICLFIMSFVASSIVHILSVLAVTAQI